MCVCVCVLQDSSSSEVALREEGEGLRVAMETVTAEKDQLAVRLSEAQTNSQVMEGQVQVCTCATLSVRVHVPPPLRS